MAWTIPWNLMALQVSGDFADLTVYTNKNGKKVAFLKAPPDKPPTELQIAQRARFKLAQAGWMALSHPIKNDYEEMCSRANVPMTGQNIWIHSALTNDAQAIQTLIGQTGITVPIPDFIP